MAAPHNDAAHLWLVAPPLCRSDNRVYTMDGKASESGKSIAEWQAQGHDLGTTVTTMPPDATLISVAKAILGM